MHVQTDFVTNSSSTAYIIFVPDSFHASDKQIDKAIQASKDINEDIELTDEQRKEVPEIVEMMKEGEAYDYYEGEDLWIVCLQIFTDEDFIVDGIELHSEGHTLMKGIREENIIHTITNHIDLDGLVESLVKGANDERQDTE